MGIIHSCTSDKSIGDLKKMAQLVANMKAKYASYILLLLIIVTVFIFWSFIPKAASSPEAQIKAKLEDIFSDDNRDDTTSSTDIKETFVSPNSKDEDKLHKHPLKNYYIASSYNTCRGPSGYEDMVSIASLRHALKKGARALDFEIYSIDNKPQVSASDFASFKVKKTYNHIPVSTVLDEIKRIAFSPGVIGNYKDPLFLNFRMKTMNGEMYRILIDKIEEYLGRRTLGTKFAGYSNQAILLDSPLSELQGKVIIIINVPEIPPTMKPFLRGDGSNSFHHVPTVNMSNIHPKHFTYRFNEIKNKHGIDRFKEENKQNFVQVFPDFSDSIKNINWGIPFSYGCQMVFMNYGTRDDFLKSYHDKFFNKSFILKPKHLRETIIITQNEDPQKESQGLGTKGTISSNIPEHARGLMDGGEWALSADTT